MVAPAAALPKVICTAMACATPVTAVPAMAPAANIGRQPLSPDTNACVVVAVRPRLTPVVAVAVAVNPVVTFCEKN